jgi:lysophospholipase L1-like esterase
VVFPNYRARPPAPAIVRGQNLAVLGDSISDAFFTANGTTQGKWITNVVNATGLVRVAAGLNANDYTRGGISGNLLSGATGAFLSMDAAYVQRCLAWLPNIVFVEGGTNDIFNGNATLTPTAYATSWDTLLAALTANVAVKSVQAIVPTVATTGGAFTLTQNALTTASIAHNATIATIQTALNTATIPFTASTQGTNPTLSGGTPLILTANTTGARGAFTIGSNTVTGGPIAVSGGLGGTPAVKGIVVVGVRDYATAVPAITTASFVSGLPAWATSVPDACRQFLAVAQRKAREKSTAAIPVVYADLSALVTTIHADPAGADPTHPSDPRGTQLYANAVLRALAMGG